MAILCRRSLPLPWRRVGGKAITSGRLWDGGTVVAQVLAGPWGGVGQRGRRGGSGAVAWLLCEDLLLASWLSVLGQVSCLC